MLDPNLISAFQANAQNQRMHDAEVAERAAAREDKHTEFVMNLQQNDRIREENARRFSMTLEDNKDERMMKYKQLDQEREDRKTVQLTALNNQKSAVLATLEDAKEKRAFDASEAEKNRKHETKLGAMKLGSDLLGTL